MKSFKQLVEELQTLDEVSIKQKQSDEKNLITKVLGKGWQKKYPGYPDSDIQTSINKGDFVVSDRGTVLGRLKKGTFDMPAWMSESTLFEGDPTGTDDVDWDTVKDAVVNAAEDIFDDVDMKKIDGIMKNLYKHKPNDTENAIQIGVDMLRSK